MKVEILVIFGVVFVFALLEALTTGLFRKPGQRRSDVIVEIVSALALSLVTQPLLLAGGAALTHAVAPQAQGALSAWPVWAVAALFVVGDDLTQYGWHRLSHAVPWLYKLHRPHHEARYMSVRLVTRNNLFYYTMMPGLWISGALIYMGGGWVYAFYVVAKMTIIIGAHSDLPWDRPLYERPRLAPLMWVVERVISTPATHHAHHGRHLSDGVTHYHGNYGNMLFVWDILFGTAKITRRFPDQYGVENLPETTTAEQLLWPLVRVRER